VATKTAEASADGVLRRAEEELAELGTDYLDVLFLRCYTHEMLQERLAPGGAFDGLQKAREQGKVRFTGMANHGDPSVLVAGIETGLVDVVIFPLNIVRREALDVLIPMAHDHDVGLVVMKPRRTQ
jgi:predicted aldo/keto reductase-like oxidoreductase